MTTLILEGFDAGPSYYYWRWDGGPAQIHVIDRAELETAVDRLTAALPVPTRSGDGDEVVVEPIGEMLDRVLAGGELATPDGEIALMTELTRVVLSEHLIEQLAEWADGASSGERIELSLSPSARTAQIPWELLVVPGGDLGGTRRLIDIADPAYSLPAGLHVGRGRATDPASASRFEAGTATTVVVLDPHTRGLEGEVLPKEQRLRIATAVETAGRVRVLGDEDGLDVPPVVTRRMLSEALRADPAPDRFVYVGHVARPEEAPAATSMLLSDGADDFGLTHLISKGSRAMSVRPLSALDLLEGMALRERRVDDLLRIEPALDPGALRYPVDAELAATNPDGATIWPSPARVALIACNSGVDLASAEAFGLAIALANSGAALITGTKWTLPTDAGIAAHARLGMPEVTPFTDAVIAIDAAHRAPTDGQAVSRVADWQRERLTAWRAGDRSALPIVWAAFATYVVPDVIVTENDPDAVPMPEVRRA